MSSYIESAYWLVETVLGDVVIKPLSPMNIEVRRDAATELDQSLQAYHF
ncbi:MAG: hypothetical protein WCL46_00905 [Chlorobium sp.]